MTGLAIAASFNAVTDTASADAALGGWMFDSALPFWADVGHAGPGLGVQEHLALGGMPISVSYRRMRVQARQIYAFSHAALMGWREGEALARDAYSFITRQGERTEGGWVRRLSPDGQTIIDPAIDLYDQAFVLLALAWYARLTNEEDPLHRAKRSVEWIQANMNAPPAGFHNVVPIEAGDRQQNPHMHLLEAALALHETTSDARYANLAGKIVRLFQTHLFDAATGTLGEFFTDNWVSAPGTVGNHVEPGHHYEWVCLLDQYERQTGAVMTAEIDRLYGFALRYGTDPATAMVWDVIERDGTPRRRSTRLWCQTEALKAHAVMARRGYDTDRFIAPTVRNLGQRFLACEPPGTWIDQFDPAGAPASDRIPTSSFYHLFTGFAELRQYARWAATRPPLAPAS